MFILFDFSILFFRFSKYNTNLVRSLLPSIIAQGFVSTPGFFHGFQVKDQHHIVTVMHLNGTTSCFYCKAVIYRTKGHTSHCKCKFPYRFKSSLLFLYSMIGRSPCIRFSPMTNSLLIGS